MVSIGLVGDEREREPELLPIEIGSIGSFDRT